MTDRLEVPVPQGSLVVAWAIVMDIVKADGGRALITRASDDITTWQAANLYDAGSKEAWSQVQEAWEEGPDD